MSTSGLSHKQQASSRPHYQTVRKVLWNMVKNCVRNRSRPDDIDTETEICTSLKSEFYLLFVDHQVQCQSWLVIPQFGFLWRSVEKYVHHNGETEKLAFCTPLKSVIYFRFVSETTGV